MKKSTLSLALAALVSLSVPALASAPDGNYPDRGATPTTEPAPGADRHGPQDGKDGPGADRNGPQDGRGGPGANRPGPQDGRGAPDGEPRHRPDQGEDR